MTWCSARNPATSPGIFSSQRRHAIGSIAPRSHCCPVHVPPPKNATDPEISASGCHVSTWLDRRQIGFAGISTQTAFIKDQSVYIRRFYNPCRREKTIADQFCWFFGQFGAGRMLGAGFKMLNADSGMLAADLRMLSASSPMLVTKHPCFRGCQQTILNFFPPPFCRTSLRPFFPVRGFIMRKPAQQKFPHRFYIIHALKKTSFRII